MLRRCLVLTKTFVNDYVEAEGIGILDEQLINNNHLVDGKLIILIYYTNTKRL